MMPAAEYRRRSRSRVMPRPALVPIRGRRCILDASGFGDSAHEWRATLQ
jgi:hypothetical protein